MSTFPTAFRNHVMPALRHHARAEALCLARGRIGWSDATGAVMRLAMARGAARLPDHLLDELIDWIDTTVLKTVVAIEADEAVAREIVDECLATI